MMFNERKPCRFVISETCHLTELNDNVTDERDRVIHAEQNGKKENAMIILCLNQRENNLDIIFLFFFYRGQIKRWIITVSFLHRPH